MWVHQSPKAPEPRKRNYPDFRQKVKYWFVELELRRVQAREWERVVQTYHHRWVPVRERVVQNRPQRLVRETVVQRVLQWGRQEFVQTLHLQMRVQGNQRREQELVQTLEPKGHQMLGQEPVRTLEQELVQTLEPPLDYRTDPRWLELALQNRMLGSVVQNLLRRTECWAVVQTCFTNARDGNVNQPQHVCSG
jgi:hypothetical protein